MSSDTRARILVVDDVPLFREVEALYLSRVGDVRTASSAAEAREQLAREPAEIVVCDLHLPDEPGDALCLSLSAAHPACAARWVFITRDETDDYTRAVRAGAADILAKPIGRADLVGAVTRLIGELRGLPRAAVREPAHLWANDRTSTGTVQNVSRGGVFIASGWLPREGTEVHIEFALPGTQSPIATAGRVMWRRDDDERAGFGLRFVALDGRTQRALARYVDEHAAA